jgi:hypothetical protein
MTRSGLLVRASGAALVLVLSACGGGGGGDSSGGGASSGGPSASSPLIPAAPPLGATLVADATTLRPLIPGAAWTYSGVETIVGASAAEVAYANTVTQPAGPQQLSATEASSNSLNVGQDATTVSHVGGEVHALSRLDLGNGQPVVLDQLELRSPVRVNDQYTTLDQVGLDLGVDVDSDGKNDVADVAIYSRVLGDEPVELTNWPQAPTVRLRTTVAVRIHGTRGQVVTESATLDVWYAVGVGPVRRVSNTPGSVAGTRVVDTETLDNFDGVTRGVGFLPQQLAVSPVGVPQLQFFGAAGFDSHALLLTRDANNLFDGASISKVSPRGVVLSSRVIAGLNPQDTIKFVRFGNTARLVFANTTGIGMWTFDSNGTPSGPPQVIKAGEVEGGFSAPYRFAVAATDSALWLSWVERPTPPFASQTLRLQPFGADGQPLAPPSILDTFSDDLNRSVLVSPWADASSNHAVLTWYNISTGNHYVVMHGGSPPAKVHSYKISTNQPKGFPLATTNGGVLLFDGLQISGVTLDATDEPLRSTTGAVDLEFLDGSGSRDFRGIYTDSEARGVVTAASRTASLDIFLPRYFDGSTLKNHSYLVELTPGSGPLATSSQTRVLAYGDFPPTLNLVSLPNNVLLFDTTSPDGVKITSVWRRQ